MVFPVPQMLMPATLRKPLRTGAILSASAAILVAVAFYCSAYVALSGRSESPVEGLVWAAVNILPWFLAFEFGKREAVNPVIALAGALFLSLGLDLLLNGTADRFWFEATRRIPALMATATLLAFVRLPGRSARPAAELPLLPRQIDWISAAGNYVELHIGGRILLHRAPLSAVESLLREEGFIRIHRSILVRRDAVKRIRSVDVLLHDGTSLKLGKKYRSAVFDHPNFRPPVPAG